MLHFWWTRVGTVYLDFKKVENNGRVFGRVSGARLAPVEKIRDHHLGHKLRF